MAQFRRVYRALLVFLVFVFGLFWVGIPALLNNQQDNQWRSRWARYAFRSWCALTCRAINVRISSYGERDQKAALIVCNHVSWLDILVIAAVCDTYFLSKSEVAKWPFIGPIAKGLGTLFIERGGKNAAQRSSEKIISYLQSGKTLLFFPEGTTTNGTYVSKFHARIYKSAVDAQADVQPIAIRFLENGVISETIPYIDDDVLIDNLLKVLALKRVDCHVSFCEPIEAATVENGRGEYAHRSRMQICAALGLEESEIA